MSKSLGSFGLYVDNVTEMCHSAISAATLVKYCAADVYFGTLTRWSGFGRQWYWKIKAALM